MFMGGAYLIERPRFFQPIPTRVSRMTRDAINLPSAADVTLAGHRTVLRINRHPMAVPALQHIDRNTGCAMMMGQREIAVSLATSKRGLAAEVA
jgi:hypothetical protein